MKCTALPDAAAELVRRHLAEAANGWSVGTWGDGKRTSLASTRVGGRPEARM